jgi:hypothetical protein
MSSLGVSVTSEPALLRYLDVVVLAVAAPILLLIGVPAAGYGIAAGAWIALRAVGVGVERAASAAADQRTEISLRLGYMLGRLFALALVIVLVRQQAGKDAGLTALAVIVAAFTIQLAVSAINRPRTR